MPLFKKRGALTIFCLILLLAGSTILFLRLRAANILAHETVTPAGTRMAAMPKVFLWAWERPENLEFINPQEIGVAFLAETIYLRGDKAIRRPRLQPLKVPPVTKLIAVVRIESMREEPPTLSNKQRASVVEALAHTSQANNIAGLQIDFDVTESERKFYRDLLFDVRKRLPESMSLSMTALASWCIYDNWLDDLPVDEAVPMLFRMGVDRHRISNYLQTGGKFRAPLCKSSLGVSTDETIATLSNTSRLYIFNPQSWSEQNLLDALERSRNENPVP
jgi:Protein of unknown function (DUF3142).